MSDPRPAKMTSTEWKIRFEDEGFDFHPRNSVYLDMEVVDTLKAAERLSDDYLATKSKTLFDAADAPGSFSIKSLQRARKGNPILFSSAYTLAMILKRDVREIAKLDASDPTEDEVVGTSENRQSPDTPISFTLANGSPASPSPPVTHLRRMAVSSIVPEISRWTKLLAINVIAVTVFYVLFY